MTIRRDLLDRRLSEIEELYLAGRVLDIGGKRRNRRGTWSPNPSSGLSWEYLNIDPSTEPDFQESAENMGLPSSSYDAFMLCEVLEHLENPGAALIEAKRILTPSGIGVITMPFLNQVHGDPGDFQRWTATKLKLEIEKAGMELVSIEPVGSLPAVIFDLSVAASARMIELTQKTPLAKLFALSLSASKPVWLLADRMWSLPSQWITTGWIAVVAAKSS